MARTSPARRGTRRLERWVLGIAMTVVAWIIERRVLKAIRTGGSAPSTDPSRSSGRLSVGRAPSDEQA